MVIKEISCLGNKWVEALDLEASAYAIALSQKFGISGVLSRLLVARGIDELSLPFYLNPKLRDLMPSPKSFKDIDVAANRIIEAIKNCEKITIYGDYDVDGAAASAIMFRFLQSIGAYVDIFIPHRVHDGYGLNVNRLVDIKTTGTSLIIAVDCGSNDNIENLDIDVVVLDHHKIASFNKAAYALVNPNRSDDSSNCTYLCAAGVVFVIVAYIASLLRSNDSYATKLPNIMEYLDLVALATICDVVPLIGLNRAFVINGLKVASKLQNKGLVALSRVLGINEPLNPYIMGYVIGPHINAAGRIDDQNIGAKLLCSKNIDEAIDLSNILVAVNKERRAIEEQNLEDIIFSVYNKYENTIIPPVIVEIGNWHQGIIGLLAARLKEKYMRPAIIFSKQNNGFAVGSARSVSSIDIGTLIHQANEAKLIEKGGGHAMAAGLTIKQENFDDFTLWLTKEVGRRLGNLYEKRILKIELILTINALTGDLCNEIDKAGPYGAGNPRPLILIKQAYIKSAKIVGDKHIAITLGALNGTNANKKAIAFRAVGTELGDLLLSHINQHCDLVGYVNLNYYRNTIYPQLQIVDAYT